MKAALGWLRAALLMLGMLLLLGFGCSTSYVAPPNAFVLVDLSRNAYLAPSCVSEAERAKAGRPGSPLKWGTVEVARSLKFEPDDRCRNAGGFVQEGRSLSGRLLERVGILGPRRPRWNPKGTWNW
jgi:hypothetical protein